MLPNVLLVILDSVRARNVSLYGYDRETTPFLKRFARTATTYTQARSPGVNSITSHTSIFTGYHIKEHNITNLNHRLEPGWTIWDQLADEYGYETAIFSNNTIVTESPVGLKAAFETVETGLDQQLLCPSGLDPSNFLDYRNKPAYWSFLSAAIRSGKPIKSIVNGIGLKASNWLPMTLEDRLKPQLTAETYTDLFLDWTDERDGPWAACINYMDAHNPYRPRPEYDFAADSRPHELMNDIDHPNWIFHSDEQSLDKRKELEVLYDGCIRQADEGICRLISRMDRKGQLQDTLIVITADHGEGFGEQSYIREAPSIGHGSSGGVHESVLHVPLITKSPGQREQMRIDEPASLTLFPDVVESIIEEGNSRTFVPEGEPVIASMAGIDEITAKPAKQYLDDLSQFRPSGRVVYEPADDGLRKYVVWDDTAVLLEFSRPGADTKIKQGGDDCVEEAFGSLKEVGIRADNSGSDIGNSIQSRLEHLGYA